MASSVSSVMPRPGRIAGQAEGRVERTRLGAAELESRGRRAGWAPHGRAGRRARRRALTPGRRAWTASARACRSRSGTAGCPRGRPRRRAGRGSARARRGSGGCGGRGSRDLACRLSSLKDSERSPILNGRNRRMDAANWRILEVRTRSGRRSGTHERDDDDDLRVLDRNLRIRRLRARTARHHRYRPASLGHRDRGAHQARRDRLVRRLEARGRPPDQAARGGGQAHQAQPRVAAEQLPRPHRPERRRPGRGPHVHLLDLRGGRRADQQLARPARDARGAPRRLRRLDEGPHDVRRAVLDGPARRPHLAARRRDHRLAVRRALDGHHDPHGRRRSTGSSRPASRGCAPCTRSATRSSTASATAAPRSTGRATTRSTSCSSPTRARSGRTARATAATRCSPRSASRCASRA